MSKVTLSITLDTEADRDLLRWLEGQENRSAAVRAALRAYLGRGGVTLADVYHAVKDLERLVRSGAVMATSPTGPPGESEEPPDLAAALDALANL